MAAAVTKIAILSSGVWQLRDIIRELTGSRPVRWSAPLRRPQFGCVVGWGLKPTSTKAIALARRADAEYIALEDGFIRSVYPGSATMPLSLVLDRTGIHYDARRPSDLEALIERSCANSDPHRLARARAAMAALRENAISKYNFAPLRSEVELGLDPKRRAGRVLLVDQTFGDSSVEYGEAGSGSFRAMLDAARRENPQSEIVVKVHPEVALGRKRGYLSKLIKRGDGLVVVSDVNPWSLLELVDNVYVVTSQLGLEALMAGKRVVCFGAPFYSSWGLTDDRVSIMRRSARPSLEQLFAAVYFDYSRYVCSKSKREISFEDAVGRILQQRKSAIGY